MSGDTLFDLPKSFGPNVSHNVAVYVTPPTARSTDPSTSHDAAEAVAPGCKECIDAIRRVLLDQTWNYRRKPITAFQIAELVERAHPRRWAEDTIRRRVKDADLMFVDKLGISPRGRACERWTL